MTLSHTFRDKGNGDCAVCSEDWDHPYHTGSNPDELAKAADALLKAIEVWEACYLDSVWRDQVQPARQKLAEVIDATPPATPVQPTASVEDDEAELEEALRPSPSTAGALARYYQSKADLSPEGSGWRRRYQEMADEHKALASLTPATTQGNGEPDWSKIPKQALVDALRNCMLGPSNVSRQDKCDLVAIAKRALSTLGEDRRKALLDAIKTETAYRTKRTTHSSPVSAPSPASGANPAAMTERLIDAAIYNEQASGAYTDGARRELNEARAAIERALSARPHGAVMDELDHAYRLEQETPEGGAVKGAAR